MIILFTTLFILFILGLVQFSIWFEEMCGIDAMSTYFTILILTLSTIAQIIYSSNT
jgi:hypothetical protein